MLYPLLGMPEGAEWLVILAIVILVFGAAKLPDLARGTGQALRIFKAETKGLRDDDKNGKTGKKGDAAQATEAPRAIDAGSDAKLADLEARQAELDAERARLQHPDA
jgi:sec-independent protein translocase protein TatA